MFSLSHVETVCSYFQIISKLVSVNFQKENTLNAHARSKR
jgi:hypothetical protein